MKFWPLVWSVLSLGFTLGQGRPDLGLKLHIRAISVNYGSKYTSQGFKARGYYNNLYGCTYHGHGHLLPEPESPTVQVCLVLLSCVLQEIENCRLSQAFQKPCHDMTSPKQEPVQILQTSCWPHLTKDKSNVYNAYGLNLYISDWSFNTSWVGGEVKNQNKATTISGPMLFPRRVL